jgi:hypothetical protein
MPTGVGIGISPCFGGGPASYAARILGTAPEIYLPLTANPNDVSGHARNGTEHAISGSIAYSSLGALFVAASGQYLSIANWTSGYSTFSLGAVLRPVSLRVNMRSVAQRNTGCWFDLFSSSDGTITVYDGSASRAVGAAAALAAGSDTYVGFTVSGAAMTPYINGVAGTPTAWSANTGADEMEVSRLQISGTDYFDGRIRHFFITQRALSAGDWANLYAGR